MIHLAFFSTSRSAQSTSQNNAGERPRGAVSLRAGGCFVVAINNCVVCGYRGGMSKGRPRAAVRSARVGLTVLREPRWVLGGLGVLGAMPESTERRRRLRGGTSPHRMGVFGRWRDVGEVAKTSGVVPRSCERSYGPFSPANASIPSSACGSAAVGWPSRGPWGRRLG